MVGDMESTELMVLGHDVRWVKSAEEALVVVPEFNPELMLIDIGLPGMDGFELGRLLRQTPQFEKTPIIALTGYAQDEDRKRSADAGFDAHYAKPMNFDELSKFAPNSSNTEAQSPATS